MSDTSDSYTVTAAELQQFIEQLEQLDSEKTQVSERVKELMAEAKGRGYQTKIIRKIVALRKKSADAVAEEEALMSMYKEALGMK